MRGHQRRPSPQRQFKFDDRFLRPPRADLEFAQPQSRQLIHSVQLEGPRIRALRLVKLPHRLQRLAQRHPGRPHSRCSLHRR